MKRCVLVVLSFLSLWGLSAQDIIVKKDGSIIKAKVLEITETTVKYKNFTNQDGPSYSINIERVLSLTYENGEQESFSNALRPQESDTPIIENTPEKKEETSVILSRRKDMITSSESNIEYWNLEKCLDASALEKYHSAQKAYKTGDDILPYGWAGVGCGILFCAIGYNLPIMVIIGGIEFLAGSILLPIGYITRGVAAGQISRIEEEYNESHHYRSSLSMSFTPTLLNNNGQLASGVGLTFCF